MCKSIYIYVVFIRKQLPSGYNFIDKEIAYIDKTIAFAKAKELVKELNHNDEDLKYTYTIKQINLIK